jgi:CSLREA domain-containing protein
MKKVRYIWTICNLLIFTNGILSQTIIVNSIDDVNDGVCNTVHCSLREAIMLANTYTQPNISFEIKPATPMPWTILPKTNLPDIKNENSNFQFSIIDTYGSSKWRVAAW